MTYEQVAAVLGLIVLTGAAIAALPMIWRGTKATGRFLKAAAKVPATIEAVSKEFAPDGNGSMRTALNKQGLVTEELRRVTTELTDDLKKLRHTHHELVNEITKAVGTAQTTAKVVEVHAKEIKAVSQEMHGHTKEDAAKFDEVLEELGNIVTHVDANSLGIQQISRILTEVKALDAEVKHDLQQFNEIDTLGREGAIDRRQVNADDLHARLEAIHEELRTLNGQTIGQMADADEGRRIEAIPEVDRTESEAKHLGDINQKDQP